MKKFAYLAFVSVLVLGVAAPALAQGVRIAIWDFDNNAPMQSSYFFSKDLGPAARNQIDAALGENADLSAKFIVVERDKLSLALKEQGLASTGAVDAQTAAKAAKLIGVKYILTGAIDKFAINTTKGGIGMIGGSKTKADVTITVRFIDTTTGVRVASFSADGSVSKGGGNFGSANLSRDAQFGIATEAIPAASKAVIAKLVADEQFMTKIIAANGSTGGIDARIIKVDGGQAYINIGSSAGVKVGDKFPIFDAGEDLIDPVTGANLGSAQKQIGTGVVTEVNDKFSILTVTGKATAKSIIKK